MTLLNFSDIIILERFKGVFVLNKTNKENSSNYAYIVGKRKEIPLINTVTPEEIEEIKKALSKFLIGEEE